MPIPAKKPMAAGVNLVPALSANASFAISEPDRRTLSPCFNLSSSIYKNPSVTFIFSCITTVSAPSGTTAPVKIRTAVPGFTFV